MKKIFAFLLAMLMAAYRGVTLQDGTIYYSIR